MAFKSKDGIRVGTQDIINSGGFLLNPNSTGSASFLWDHTALGLVKDGVIISARDGGSQNYKVTITPSILSNNHTQTLQNKTGNIALLTNNLGEFASTTSSQLSNIISDKSGTGAVVFNNAPIIIDPIINNIAASTPSTLADLWSEIYTGSITIGKNLSNSGSLNIASSGLGFNTINIGNPNSNINLTGTLNFSGNFNLGINNAIVLATNSTGQLFSQTTTGTSSTVVLSTNPTFLSGVHTSSSTFNLFNDTATTINAFGNATLVNLGNANCILNSSGGIQVGQSINVVKNVIGSAPVNNAYSSLLENFSIDGTVNKLAIRRSSTANQVPDPSELDWGEMLVNFTDGKLYYKNAENEIRYFYDYINQLEDEQSENIIYVAKNGNVNNNGMSYKRAVPTFEKALELAALRGGAITLIDVSPGIYETEGHLDMPDNCILKCVHRSVIIKPKAGFEERNVIRMGSGCFIEGFLFEGFRIDSYDDPSEGFAVSFRPGAVIRRVPYAHKIAIRTPPTWTLVAPPLDRNANPPNPLVGKGGGVVLCDGAMCSQYSVFPNIMTWGATPVTYNGLGYVAKNGGLINAVNAVSMWAHIHFLAISGGQIILSGCSTQFGDFTMVSKGSRFIVYPTEITIPLSIQLVDATLIANNQSIIIDNMWNYLVSEGYTVDWTPSDETYTRRDAALLLQAIAWVLRSAVEQPMLDFAKGLFDTNGDKVFAADKLLAFIASFEFMRDEINNLSGFTAASQLIVTALIEALNDTITGSPLRNEPSTITAIGHTWTAVMAGVALTKIPPARNKNTILESIKEINGGVVIASGQDDQGSALFIGGLEINADTGELTGPPFDQAVGRIATRTAIARSF